MSLVDNIIILHSKRELSNGSKFTFNFLKDDRKFLIGIRYLGDQFEIKAAYEDNICPVIYCKIENLKEIIENIDVEFKDKFKRKIKTLGPIIYGGGHGTGFAKDCWG